MMTILLMIMVILMNDASDDTDTGDSTFESKALNEQETKTSFDIKEGAT